jgi:pSer/pThr/pTyr-binding forkhead associated (FHA) protein
MKAMLVVKAGLTDRKEYVLEEGKTLLVGRSREADIIVKDKLASRHHCKITPGTGDEWTIADLGSSNGTYVNRQRVTTHTLLEGDTLYVGRATLEFRLTSAVPAAPATPAEAIAALPSEPEDTDAPPLGPAAESPPPQPEPARDSAPAPAEAKKAHADEDLRDLFDFLDRIEGDSRPAKPQEPPAKASQEERDTTLRLVEEDAGPRPEPKPEPKPEPPPQPKKEQGGLLAFLRRKKPS